MGRAVLLLPTISVNLLGSHRYRGSIMRVLVSAPRPRHALVVLAVLVVSSCFAGAAASPARADAGTQPYLSPLEQDDLWHGVEGSSWPDTFPADWAAGDIEAAAEAAGAMPELSTLGTLGLGAAAFDVGWKIGRTIDTKWLHLSGDIGTVLATTPESVWWEWRSSVFCDSDWSSGCQNNVYLLRTNSYSYYCDPFDYPLAHHWWGDSGCPYPTWLYTQMEAAPGTKVTVSNPGSIGCGTTWGPCYAKTMAADAMRSRLVASYPSDYSNQAYSYSTSIPAPSETQTAITAIQSSITASGEAAQKVVDSALSTNWAAPDASGGGGGYTGGGDTTSANGNQCDIDDDVERATDAYWDSLMDADPTTYQQWCEDAWGAARALGAFDQFGGFHPEVFGNVTKALSGEMLANETVIEALTADGSSIKDWAKMKTAQFDTPHGPAEIHWYEQPQTGKQFLGEDFKLVFQEVPSP